MFDVVFSLLMVGVGVVAGIMSVTVGSSSLLTLPVLLIAGLPPAVALATSKFGLVSSFVTGGITYYREGIITNKKLAAVLAVAALAGSLIGARLVLTIPDAFLKTILVILLAAVLVLVIFEKKKEERQKTIPSSQATILGSFFVVLLLSIYAGFFGPGFGTFLIFALVYLFGFTFVRSAALMTLLNLVTIVGALIVFGLKEVIDYTVGLPLLLGTALGGWLGVRYAVLKGNQFVKKLFIFVTIILIFKLIVDLM